MVSTATPQASRGAVWTWTVCGLLLVASAINYMDRQTLAGASVRISREFHLNQTQYGEIESVFGYAFAAGSLVFGWMADRFAVRWVYPGVLLAWSIAGFLTGWASNAHELWLARGFLGFFEAGHWPCAIRTTRHLLDDRRRSLGNGLLQSGATVGAITTPLILRALMGEGDGAWRLPFLVVGIAGALWIFPWLLLVRDGDLPPGNAGSSIAGGTTPFWNVLMSRRFGIVLCVLACINTTWQVYRAWLMKFLQEGRGYPEAEALYFNSAWFAAADVGCLLAGAVATRLALRGLPVHSSRLVVFGISAVLCGIVALVPWLGRGPLLLTVLGLGAAGALGVFPIYHSLTQDLSAEHQGKVTGIAGVAGWLVPGYVQKGFGQIADLTGSFNLGLALASLLPMLALIPLCFWGSPRPTTGSKTA